MFASCTSARNTDVSENSGFSLQILHFDKVFHYKPSILGYPYFWKHPYHVCICSRVMEESPLRGKVDNHPWKKWPDTLIWWIGMLTPSLYLWVGRLTYISWGALNSVNLGCKLGHTKRRTEFSNNVRPHTKSTRWWFHISFLVSSLPGELIQFDSIFQMGWFKHQLE